MPNYSMIILYFLFLIQISDYVLIIGFYINNNKFNIIPEFKIGRSLAEGQSHVNSNVSKSNLSTEQTLDIWLQHIQNEVFTEFEKSHGNNTCDDNSKFVNWVHNKTNEIATVLNVHHDPNHKKILNNGWNIWNKLISYFEDYFKYIKENFSCDINKVNVTNLDNWMHNKSLHIVRDLNLEHNPDKKKYLNDTHTIWDKLSGFVKEIINKSQNETMLNNSTVEDNSTTTTLSPTSMIPSTTISSPSPTPPLSDITSFLPITSSTPISLTTSTLSPSPSLPLSTPSEADANISTSPENDTEDSSINPPTIITTSTEGIVPLVVEEQSSGISSAVCTGLICGPTIAAISIPAILIGSALCLVLLYKHTPIGSLLGRDNQEKRKRRKRSRKRLIDNTTDSLELLNESGKSSPKRSRLSSFLRAFGFKYRNTFPFVEEGKPVNERPH